MLIAPERECPLHIVESLPCVLRRTHSPENALSFFRKGNLSRILPKPVVLQKGKRKRKILPVGVHQIEFFSSKRIYKKKYFANFGNSSAEISISLNYLCRIFTGIFTRHFYRSAARSSPGIFTRCSYFVPEESGGPSFFSPVFPSSCLLSSDFLPLYFSWFSL